MKHCNDCGFSCPDDAKFCSSCGYAFKDEVEDSTGELKAKEESNMQEGYSQQMLYSQQMMNNMMLQQQQMQQQMQMMQQQQMQQQMSRFNNQSMQPQMQAPAQKVDIYIRNKWSLIAAIACVLPFLIGNFVIVGDEYWSKAYTLKEFCETCGEYSAYNEGREKIYEWIISLLPITLVALIIVLVIGGFKAVYGFRGFSIGVNIAVAVVALFYIVEETDEFPMGGAFWLLVIGIGIAIFSCGEDVPKSHVPARALGYGVSDSSFNLSKVATEMSYEGKSEWRCPKCDTRNTMDYMFCKTCGTSRS